MSFICRKPRQNRTPPIAGIDDSLSRPTVVMHGPKPRPAARLLVIVLGAGMLGAWCGSRFTTRTGEASPHVPTRAAISPPQPDVGSLVPASAMVSETTEPIPGDVPSPRAPGITRQVKSSRVVSLVAAGGSRLYYGPLRKSEEPALIVLGSKFSSSYKPPELDQPMDGPPFFLWVFKTGVHSLYLRWCVPLEGGGVYASLTPFSAIGDNSVQIALNTGGADWEGVVVYGFRGRSGEPKELLRTEGHVDDVTVGVERGRTVIVEHYSPEALIHWGGFQEPLPKGLRGHRHLRRTYTYNPARDAYVGPSAYTPDPDREVSVRER